MRRTPIVTLLAVFLLALPTVTLGQQAQGVDLDPADALVGLWRTEPTDQGFAIVRITRDEDRYRGEIVSLSKPNFPPEEGPEWAGKPKVDRNNPDAAKQSRPIVGLEIVWGFAHKAPGRYEGGRIYDPENGKTYKAKMRLQPDGTLDVRGFVGFSLLGRTTQWQPVEDDGWADDG